MNRSFRTTFGVILLLALIAGGFASGKAIGSRLRPRNDTSLSPWSPGSGSENTGRSAQTVPPAELFASVLDKVQQDYVCSTGSTPPSNTRLTEGAVGRMVASLQDPHTFYLNSLQTESRVNAILGKRSGIGAELAVVTSNSKADDIDFRFLTVKSVAHGSPAERAGLRTGDRITEINGQWVIAYPVLSESARGTAALPNTKRDVLPQKGVSNIKPGISAVRAIQLLTTGAGASYDLTVARAGQAAPEQFQLTTRETTVPAIEYKSVANGVMYLRINAFNSEAASAIDAVFNRQQDWSTGIVIDLRQNSGGVDAPSTSPLNGYLCALDLVGHIVQNAEVGEIEKRPGVRTPIVVKKTRPASNQQARVAVLIDGGTSNIAEMAAAGMRDVGGALLFGSHTFGDDVLPYLALLKSGGAVEMASAHLLTKNGVDLRAGVSPDILVDSNSNSGSSDDPANDRALRFACAR